MTKQNDVISPEVMERETLTTFDYAPIDADAETRFDADGNADEEARRREAARLKAARQMLFDANVDELDDANAVALFNSVSKSVCGLPDATGDMWFGKRKSADPRENLKMMRRVFQGEWDLIEDAEAKAFNAKTPEGQKEQALENEGVLQKAGRLFGVAAANLQQGRGQSVALGGGGAATYDPQKLKGDLAASEAERTAKERFKVNARQKLLTLMAYKGAISDRAALVMTKSLAEGGIDPRDMAALTKEDQESVFAGFAAVRGEATHGEMFGGLIDMDFEDGTDVGNRAQMALYGAWNGLCSIFTTPFEFGDTLIDWGWHGLVPLVATKAGVMNAADRAAHKAALDYEQLKDRCAEALTQPLPEGGFFGTAVQGLAENWMWFIPYGLYAKAVGGAAKAAGLAKTAGKVVKATKAATPAAKAAEAARKAYTVAALGDDVEKSAAAFAKLVQVEQKFATAMKRYGVAAKRLGAAKWNARAWKGAVAGAKYVTVSNFAQEFVETADAMGMDRETSVPLAIAVGFVNDKIEQIEVPGLEEHIPAAVMRGIGGHALVEALKRNKGAVLEYLKRREAAMLKAGAVVGFNEGFVEEPLQQIVTDHALLMQKDIEEARKNGFEIGDFAAEEIVRQLAATTRDVQTWFEVAGDMLPMAFGYMLTSGNRELATAKAREWSRNSNGKIAKALKAVGLVGEGAKDEGYADYVTRRLRTRAAVWESLTGEGAPADAGAGKAQSSGGGFDPSAGFEDERSEAQKLADREYARAARREARADDLMQKGRDAFRKRGKENAAEAIMRETGMPRVVAEQMAEFYSIEEIYETAGAFERRAVRASHLAEVDAETLAAHPNVVAGSVMTDAETGNVAATFDFGGKQLSVVFQKDARAPFLNEDGTVDEAKLCDLTADDSEYGKSWDERHDRKWAKMDIFERRLALLYMNGNSVAGGGHFTFADANGETVEIDADSVVALTQNRLTDLAYKILPSEMAADVVPSGLSNGWTLEHEIFHSCWRVVRMTLSNEEIATLAAKMGVETNGEAAFAVAADGTRQFAAWTKALDEKMAYDFQYYASGRYVAQPARDAIERGMRKLADWGGRLFKEQEAKNPETGAAFTLKDFYDAVLEGRLGSGNMGIERLADGAGVGKTAEGNGAASENELPVGVSEKELKEQEEREAADGAAAGKTRSSGEAESKENKEGAEGGKEGANAADGAAAGKTHAEDGEPRWQYLPFNEWDKGKVVYLKKAGEPARYVCELRVVNLFDIKTSFDVKDSVYQNRHDAQGEEAEAGDSDKAIEKMAEEFDADFTGLLNSPDFGASLIVIDKKGLVIARNHGTRALQKAAKRNSPAWQIAREKMVAMARYRGLDIDTHAAEAPVVVGVLQRIEGDPTINVKNIGRKTNESGQQSFSDYNKATNDAQILQEKGIIKGIYLKANGEINEEKSKEKAEEFFDAVKERKAIETVPVRDDYGNEVSTTVFSPSAKRRLQNAMLAYFFGGDKTAADALRAIIEKDLDMENERRALLSVAPILLKVAEERPNYDISGKMGEALRRYVEWRQIDRGEQKQKGATDAKWHKQGGFKWRDYAARQSLLETYDPVSEMIAQRLAESRDLRSFASNGDETAAGQERARRHIVDWFAHYADAARKVNVETTDLFGAEPAKPIDLLQIKYSVADLREMAFSSGGDFTRTEQEAQTERLIAELSARGEVEHFDAEHLYHGGRDWREPSVAFVGSGQGGKLQGKGFYMTSMRSDADWYARIAQSKATEAKRTAAANGEGSLFRRIGAFLFKTPKFVYELSLHDAHVVSYERTPLPGVARAAEEFVRERGLRGAEHLGWTTEKVLATLAKNPSAAGIELCLSRLRHADGSLVTAPERAALFMKGGVDATWIDYETPAAADKAVHFVVYDTAKLKTDHKWRNEERMFSVADAVRPIPITQEFMDAEIAKYGTADVATEAAHILPDGRGLKGGGKAFKVGGRSYVGMHDFLRDDVMDLYERPEGWDADSPDEKTYVANRAWLAEVRKPAFASLMNAGLIRVSSNGIELARRPSAAQIDKLWDWLDELAALAWEDGDDYLMDVDDANGETLFTVAYRPKTSVRRIIEDIRSYFDENIVPEGATGALPNALKARGAEMAFSTSQVATTVIDMRKSRERQVKVEQFLNGIMTGDRYHDELPLTQWKPVSVVGEPTYETIKILTLDNRLRFGEKSLSDYIQKAMAWGKDGKRHYLFTQKGITASWVKKQIDNPKSDYYEQALYFVATALERGREQDKMTAWGWNSLVFRNEPKMREWWDYKYDWAADLHEDVAEDAAQKLIDLKTKDVDRIVDEIRRYGSTSVMSSDADDILSNVLAREVAKRLGVKFGRSDHIAFVDFSGYASQRYVNAIKDAFEAGHTVIDGIFTLCHEKPVGYCQFFATDVRDIGGGVLKVEGGRGEMWRAMNVIAKWANPAWTPACLTSVPGYQNALQLLYRVPRYALAHVKPSGLIAADDPQLKHGVQLMRLGPARAFAERLDEERKRVQRSKAERIMARETWSELGIRQILNMGSRQTLDDGVKRYHATEEDMFELCTDWEFLTKLTDCDFWVKDGELGVLEKSALECFERIAGRRFSTLVDNIERSLAGNKHVCVVIPRRGEKTNAFEDLCEIRALRELGNKGCQVFTKFVRVDVGTSAPLKGEVEACSPYIESAQTVILVPDAGDGSIVAEVASAIRKTFKHPPFRRMIAASLAAEAGGKVEVTKDDLALLRRDEKFGKLSATQLGRLLGYATNKATYAEIFSATRAEDHGGAAHGRMGSTVGGSRPLGAGDAPRAISASGSSGGNRSNDKRVEEDGLSDEEAWQAYREQAREFLRELKEQLDAGEISQQEYDDKSSPIVRRYLDGDDTAFSVAALSAAADLENEKRHTIGGLKHVVRAPRGGAQKRGDTIYPDAGARLRDMAFSVGARRKEEIRSEILSVRKDFDEGDIGIVLEEIDKYDKPKKVNLAVHWIITGAITLPQDEYKLDEALKLADKKKSVDLFRFKSPEELFLAYQAPLVDSRIVNPDDVPELKRSAELADGVVIYDVDETLVPATDALKREYESIKDPIQKKAWWNAAEDHGKLRPKGQVAMRKILNSHWGKEASPWCLLQGDANGNLTPQSLHWWKKYSALPKRVAFKDGKLLSFMGTDKNNGAPPIPGQPAGDKCREQWWDRKDRCSWLGVPFEGELPGDPLRRSTCVIYQRNNKRVLGSGFWRGNKTAGRYEYWSDISTLAYRYDTENGKRIYDIKWNADGEVEELCRGGESVSCYAPNGRFHASPRYVKDNKKSGRLVDVDNKALVRYEDYGAEPHLESNARVEWNGLGGIESYSKYRLSENGLHVGTPTRISRYAADNVATFTFWRENGEIISARFEQGRLQMNNLAGVFVESRDNEIVLSAHNLENGGEAKFYTPSGQTSLPQPVLEKMLQEARREIEETLRKTLDEIDYLTAKYSGENMPTLPNIPAVPGMKDKELFALWKSNDEILDAKGEPTAEQIAFARARREAAEEGREGVSYSVADAADGGEERVVFFANGRQKQGGRIYPDIGAALRDAAFSVADVRERVAKARSELPPERIDAFMAELAKLETPKLKKLCAHWFVKGAIELPKDLPRVKYAVRLGELNRRDLFRYASPLDAIRAIEGERGAIGVRIDPDDVPYLFNRTDIGDGVVIYDVSEVVAPDDDGEYWQRFEEAYRKGDDEERRRINVEAEQDGVVLRPCGQIAVRKIMNSHWGKGDSPWCLLHGDKNGRLTGRGAGDEDTEVYNSAYYWERYSSLPKRVAFKDGEIVSFMGTEEEGDEPRPEQPAGDMCAEQWWDRDDASYPGVPVVHAVKFDGADCCQVHIHTRDGKITPWGKIWKGNLKDGVAYVWTEGVKPFLQRRQKSVSRKIEELVAWNRLGMVTDVRTQTFEGRWGGYTGRTESLAFNTYVGKDLSITYATTGVASISLYPTHQSTPDEYISYDHGRLIKFAKRGIGLYSGTFEFFYEKHGDVTDLMFRRENGGYVTMQLNDAETGVISLVVKDAGGDPVLKYTPYIENPEPRSIAWIEGKYVERRHKASPFGGLADEVRGVLRELHERAALLKEGYDALIDARPEIPAKPDLTDAEIAAALPKREDYEPEKVIERVLAKRAEAHESDAPKNADAAEAEDQAFSIADEMRFAVYNRKYDWDDFKELIPRVIYATSHPHLVGYDHPDKGAVYYRFKFLKAAKRLQEAEGLAEALAASPDPRKKYQGKYLLGKHFGRLPEAREAARHFWSDRRLAQLKQIIGTERPAQWLYVRNDTGRDTNMMPRAFAELLAERFGGEAVGSVYKISDERNTGAELAARAGRNFRWKGEIDKSGNPQVFLVDDMWTTGSTTVSLMEYLKDQGVEARGIVTLAVAANGADIVPTSADKAKFVRKARVPSMLEAEDEALFDVNRLTGSEMIAYALKASPGAFALREWFGTQYGNPGEGILEVYNDDKDARLAARAAAKAAKADAPLFASGVLKPGNVKGKPRQATFDFGAFSVAYPHLDRMSDDELLTSALAIRAAYDPKKYSERSRSETAYGFMRRHRKEVEEYVSRAHPEWAGDYGKVTSRAAMIMLNAQLEARKIRKAREQGVSESAILDRLPKDMKGVYRGELDAAWRQGAKGALRGEKMLDRVKENARRKATRAAAVQAGVDPALFEQWAGVDFAESLEAVLQNPREASEDAPKTSDASDNAELAEAADALAKAGGGVTGADGKPLDVKELEDPGAFAGYLIDLASKYWREKNGLGENAAVGQDAVSLQFLRRTMQNVYRRIVREIVYSGARETATRAIDNFGSASTVWSLKSAMTFVGEIVHARHVRETKKELCEKLDTLLKTKLGAQGRFKADKEELRRKVSAELELRARYMRHVLWLTKEAAAEEAGHLVRRMEKLSAAYGDADADIDQSREFREIQRELNILREFGALRYRPLTEILAATEYWTNAAQGSGEEILARMREREVRTQKAASILAAAVNNPKRTTRVEGGKLQTINNYVVGHMGFVSMLQDMIRYSKGAERRAAEQIIDYIALEIQKAGDRARAETRRQNDAFFRAVETIYGKPFKKVMAEMCAEDERFAPFMNVRGGKRVEATKARAMQLLVSLMQGRHPGDSYFDNVVRHGRQRQGAEIAALLTQADMRMIEWLRHWYEDNRAGLSEVCEALFGIGVYSESPSYFPVKMLLEKQGLEAAEGVGWTAFPKALTPRVKNERDFDTSADIFSLWAARMDEAAQWKAHARLGLEMRGIFGRSELQEAITSNHGGKVNQLVLQFITDILSGHAAADRSDSGVAKAADWIRGWTALTALSWNVSVMVKQTTSIPAFGFEIGLRKTATYTVTAFSPDGWSAMEKIWNSEQRKTRWDVGNSEAVANALRRRDAGAFKRFVLTGMICNKVGDVVPGLVVGQGIYRDCIERGMSEENAMATVWMLIERTQQSARMENQPTQQRRSKLGRLTYQFLSTQQQYLQYEMRAFRELAANPSGKTAKGVLRVVALNHFILTSLYFWMGELYKALLGAEPPEDRLLDWMISNLLGPFGALFILGFCCSETLERLLKGKSYGKSSSMMPMEEFTKRVIGDGMDVMEAIFSNEDTWEDVVHEAMQFLSGFSAPVRDARKIDRNILRPEVYEADERRRKRRKAAARRRRE